MIESVSSKLAITIIKQKVVVSFIKGTSTPTGLIIQVINNDLFLTVIQARIQKFFKGGGGFQGGSKTRGSQEPELLTWKSWATTIHMYIFV